jgi:ribosomal protein S18 acetylase RimI-like enzyme
MTTPQRHNSPELICRRLSATDLSSIAEIHRLAFPNGTLTAFGTRCIEKYYSWHMEGKHAVETIGLQRDGALIGFCVLLWHNQFFGFLQRAFPNILGRLLCSPAIAVSRGFVSRLRGGVGLLMGRGGAAPQPATIRLLAIAVHPSLQGNGYAKTMLQAGAEIAGSRGASTLALSVHPENERAVRAYLHDGWERVLQDGVWKGVMHKSLRKRILTTPTVSVL